MLPEKRKRRLGSTDVAALFGLNPWRTQMDVWERIVEGKKEPQSPAMLRGIKTEPVLREMYVNETGAKLEPRDYDSPWIIYSDEYDFACVSPDDWATTRDGLKVNAEYKSANRFTAGKWGMPPDGLPDQYLVQLAWAMAIGGRDYAELYVGFGDDVKTEPGAFQVAWTRLYRVERDLDLEARLIDRAGEWWAAHVTTGTPPPTEPDHPKNQKKRKK